MGGAAGDDGGDAPLDESLDAHILFPLADGWMDGWVGEPNYVYRSGRRKEEPWEEKVSDLGLLILFPVGAGAHLGGQEEVGMEGEGYGGGVWDAGPL